MGVPLVQCLKLFDLVVDNDAGDAAQLPCSVDSIGRTAWLITEAHIIRVLVVERNPLRLAGTFDVRESDLAVVTVDAGDNDSVATEVGFLLEGVSCGRGVLAVVGLSLDRCHFSSLDVQVVDIMPLHFERLLLLINFNGQPDVSRLPQ